LYDSLAPQTRAVEPEPEIQAPAPPSKSFWLQLQSSKIDWPPDPGSGSTALLRRHLGANIIVLNTGENTLRKSNKKTL